MPSTQYIDTTMKVGSIQARTDAAGAAVTDVDGEELRLYAALFSAGVLEANDLEVTPGSSGLTTDVGSGTLGTNFAGRDSYGLDL